MRAVAMQPKGDEKQPAAGLGGPWSSIGLLGVGICGHIASFPILGRSPTRGVRIFFSKFQNPFGGSSNCPIWRLLLCSEFPWCCPVRPTQKRGGRYLKCRRSDDDIASLRLASLSKDVRRSKVVLTMTSGKGPRGVWAGSVAPPATPGMPSRYPPARLDGVLSKCGCT